jgi:hypothetical protein
VGPRAVLDAVVNNVNNVTRLTWPFIDRIHQRTGISDMIFLKIIGI